MAHRRYRVDLDGIKGRIAEALVESIFRRAGFKMTRFGKESDVRRMLQAGKDQDLAPDFLALKGQEAPGAYQTLTIEVKYRSDLTRELAVQESKGTESLLAKSREKWPNLYLVFVTDHPADGKGCFQVVDLSSYEPGGPVTTQELHEIEPFQIYSNNVRDHEELAKRLFGLMSSFPT